MTSATEVAARLRALRVAQTGLRQRSMGAVLSSLDRVVDGWLAPISAWRARAERILPEATGFSSEMIRYGLPLLLEPLRAHHVRRLMASEVGPASNAPAVIAHIMSGNIPALAAPAMVLSLAIGSCALVKAAGGDRAFPSLFAESIGSIDAALGSCVDAMYWSGGNAAIEDVVFRGADLVVAFGSDASIAAMQARARRRFIGHGHRISFAVITRELATSAVTCERLAEDLSLWDQRGCLSPQVCFVEGNFDQTCSFADALAPHLDAAARRLPPGTLTLEEQTAIRRFRDDAEWRALAGEAVLLLTSADGLAWTLVVEGDASFRPTPLGRSLRLLPVNRIETIAEIIAPARGKLEAAGIATPAEQRHALDALLKSAGVHWITDLGQMQKPPLSWSQGGRPRVADWFTKK